MAGSGRAMLALLVIFGVRLATATQYTVAGDGGWTFQNSNNVYDDQFKVIKLFVGDNLLFPYTAPHHNVDEIPPSDLASCNFANPIQIFTSSDPVIHLTTPGVHAFACQIPAHCSQFGMVLEVTIHARAPTAAPSSPPCPAPVAPHTPVPAPGCRPTAAPVTTLTPAPGTSAPAPTPTARAPVHTPSPGAPNGSEPITEAPAPSPAGYSAGSIVSTGPATVVVAIMAGFLLF